MGFLRRLFGGDPAPEPGHPPGPESVEDEQARDRELLLEEARRLDDELIQRQLRYADRSWRPPAQGGDRRADDTEDEAGDRG